MQVGRCQPSCGLGSAEDDGKQLPRKAALQHPAQQAAGFCKVTVTVTVLVWPPQSQAASHTRAAHLMMRTASRPATLPAVMVASRCRSSTFSGQTAVGERRGKA